MKVPLPTKLLSSVLATGQYIFAAAGIAALAYCASVAVESDVFQSKEMNRIAQERELKTAFPRQNTVSASTAEVRRKAPIEGAAIANLVIPRIALATVVVEGDEDGDLKLAAGHIPGTALPGEPGNIGIAGHRDTFFRSLRLIHEHDEIVLTTPHEEDQYSVVSTEVVDPDDVGVLRPTSRDSLTLVTCYPFYYLGAAPKRFIVRAEKNGTSTGGFATILPLTVSGLGY
jgi:sortase A